MKVILYLDPETLSTFIVGFTTKSSEEHLAEYMVSRAEAYMEVIRGEKILEHVWVAEDERLDMKTDKGERSLQCVHPDYIKHKRIIMAEPSESFP